VNLLPNVAKTVYDSLNTYDPVIVY